MSREDLIEKAEQIQSELEDSDINDKYKPAVFRAILTSKSGSLDMRDTSTGKEVKITQSEEEIKIELDGSILETEEGKEAVAELCDISEAPKKAVVSTLTYLESKGKAGQPEIADFAGYSNTSAISEACTTLTELQIAESEGEDGEKKTFQLHENWVQNLLEQTKLKDRKSNLLDFV